MPTDKEKQEALAEWRKENWLKIFTENRTTLEQIRDDPETSNRDRVEAAKTLARMVDGLSAEKIVSTKKDIDKISNNINRELTEEEQREYELAIGIIPSDSTKTM